MVSSRSSTALPTRAAASGCSISRPALCSVIPVANSRWIARSCRSRAIRSRSCSRATCSDWRRCRPSSRARAAWAAKPESSSTSLSSNTGRPASRLSRSEPDTWSSTSRGMATVGPCAGSMSGIAWARGSVRTSAVTTGFPVRAATPAREPRAGTTRPRSASALRPCATSTQRSPVSRMGSRTAAVSASATSRACRATRLRTSPEPVPDSRLRAISPRASRRCSRRRLSR